MTIQRLRGTQDILPSRVQYWQYIEGVIRAACRDFGYQEIRTPIFEFTELFVRGVGETTDIVNKEMYTFMDQGNNSLTLRPECTAAVCRAYVENKLYGQVEQPVKLYYIGPMFRHEKPQAGRFRQFHQLGVEVLGADQPVVDAETIRLAWEIYRRLGLTGLQVHLNSIGCPQCRALYKEQLQAFLQPRLGELCADCQSRFARNPLRILDCKQATCQSVAQGVPLMVDFLCADCQSHLDQLRILLDAGNIPYHMNPRLVRGLDYYRKTAFEIIAQDIGAQSAICGGGRYDGLVEEIGGPATPAIGWAMGLERVLSALEMQNKLPVLPDTQFAMIIMLGEQAMAAGFRLTGQLREQGIPVGMDLLGKSLKAQLRAADRNHCRVAVIQGEDELERGMAVVRDLVNGEQREMPQTEVMQYILAIYRQYREEVK
ncbi:MAG: histidine--tRNA ligase [Peptococcaceae bacterium]|jgi:histidyl-tRNA synthetase|nr:histidine--tRNA ligase [Peptococcaceae bacterium]